MKLSNKGRYAVRALFDIAFYNRGQPTQVKDIAERQDIPARFLEQIFQDLKRAGMVGSKRGPQGGYSLLLSADELRLGDIFQVTEGPILLSEEKASSGPPQAIAPSANCTELAEQLFLELSGQIKQCLDAVTIGSLCRRAEAAGLRRPSRQRYTYMI